ncbi:hypothetical protein AVEN_223975-1 [Araneus ventricosus]|uniref:Reverse transcriptase domain-containing protein n=1 Tax=Araneus ventricosus TaxID=182803 RepID=A0A4Y2GI96_ARAVE|nr:hypothetical protein AVEN_223975-1 [Araneus ventricosus]
MDFGNSEIDRTNVGKREVAAISDLQYCFIPKRSTTTNLFCSTDEIIASFESGSQLDVIYTDFSKAFDSIDMAFFLKSYMGNEETDCTSDISEVDLNLGTYKPSTSNRLISLTDPKYKQLTPFVSKSSQMRLGLPSTAVVGDRFGVSDRTVVAITSSVLHDVGPITSNNSDLVVDNNKLRREKA